MSDPRLYAIIREIELMQPDLELVEIEPDVFGLPENYQEVENDD